MDITYDTVYDLFLKKVTEYKILELPETAREDLVLSYLKSSAVRFKRFSGYSLTLDDENKKITTDLEDSSETFEIADILSDGMLVLFYEPYKNSEELLEMQLSTKDFETRSSASLSTAVGTAYDKVKKNFEQRAKDYSYHVGDLTDLHL